MISITNPNISEPQYTLLSVSIVEYNKYIMHNMESILGYKDWAEQSFNVNVPLTGTLQYKFYIADKINALFSFPDWYLHTVGSLIPQEWADFIIDESTSIN